MSNKKNAIVIGGGPVGCAQACFLSRKGFQVQMFEARDDIRGFTPTKGKSINLTLSDRGIRVLHYLGVKDKILSQCVPVYGRYIHPSEGPFYTMRYGKDEQCLMSINRNKVNEILLSDTETNYNVKTTFRHKAVSCNFETSEVVFQGPNGEQVCSQADLICGCDGAFSTVRTQMMRKEKMDFSQKYHCHGYMELHIPPNKDGQYALDMNYLHLWPRGEFMLLALPNLDRSFTCTLFLPFDTFKQLKTESDIMNFWQTHFPDSIPLIGEEALKQTVLGSKPLPMVSIKCHPYHLGNNCVIMGDAAHAMVPFYGQGLNCGLEDCLIFDELMNRYNNDLSLVLPGFTEKRIPDAEAICDLAIYNCKVMCSKVRSRWFLFRGKVDSYLHWMMPNTFIPIYQMVAFTSMRYNTVIKQWQRQEKLVNIGLFAMATLAAVCCLSLCALQKSGFL
ncbi:kynurenine 3-monooxygenase-like [Glandiceps talaboti]